MKYSFIFLFTLLLCSLCAFSQSKGDSVHVITLKDGSTLIGKIKERKSNEIVFESNDVGTVTIPLDKIKKITYSPASSIQKNGEYWFPNPNETRLLYAPTARNLKAGEGYFQDIYIFFAHVNVGITDYISIGGGLSLIPSVPINEQMFIITPKIGGQVTKNFHLAGGVLYAYVAELSFGILYSVATYGSSDHNITAGIGYGFIENELAERPVIMFGGMTRVSKRIGFVLESWMIPYKDRTTRYINGVYTEQYTNKYNLLMGPGIRFDG